VCGSAIGGREPGAHGLLARLLHSHARLADNTEDGIRRLLPETIGVGQGAPIVTETVLHAGDRYLTQVTAQIGSSEPAKRFTIGSLHERSGAQIPVQSLTLIAQFFLAHRDSMIDIGQKGDVFRTPRILPV